MGERIIISINGLEQLDIHIKTEQKEKRTGERKGMKKRKEGQT